MNECLCTCKAVVQIGSLDHMQKKKCRLNVYFQTKIHYFTPSPSVAPEMLKKSSYSIYRKLDQLKS